MTDDAKPAMGGGYFQPLAFQGSPADPFTEKDVHQERAVIVVAASKIRRLQELMDLPPTTSLAVLTVAAYQQLRRDGFTKEKALDTISFQLDAWRRAGEWLEPGFYGNPY